MIRKVKIKKDAEEKETDLHLLEITAYKTGKDTYELKHAMDGVIGGKTDFFMKRLSPAGSTIHLYEHLERRYDHKSDQRVTYLPKYFVQFPNEHRNTVWALSGKRLSPHFNQKMAEVVRSCNDLKQKITNKEKGYAYTQFTTRESEKANVVLRIINEYNDCQKSVKAFSVQEQLN
jgi:hypothetical protein